MKKIVKTLGVIALLFISFGAFAQKPIRPPLPHGQPPTAEEKARIQAQIDRESGPHWLYLHYTANGKNVVYKCGVEHFFDFIGDPTIWAKKSCVDDAIKKAHLYTGWKFVGWSLHYKDGGLRFDMPSNEWTYKVIEIANRNYFVYEYKKKK